jgi:hypothetical protein
LSDALKITQLAALLLAAIAALCACVVIMYRFYARPETPESFEAWQARLESHGLNDAATDFANKEMRAAFDRIDKNHGVNAVRYGWLIFGFLAAMLSLIADIVTLGIHAIEKLHS